MKPNNSKNYSNHATNYSNDSTKDAENGECDRLRHESPS